MLVEGFKELSTMYVNYNYDYYPEHLDRLGGFRKDNDYMEYLVTVPETVPDKFSKVAEMITRRYGLRVQKFSRRDLLQGGWGRKIFELVNETYSNLYGYSHLSERQIDKIIDDYIKIADTNLITSVMDGDKMVAFGVTFPSFSKALQKNRDGRLFPMGWWQLLRILKWHKTDTVDLLLIGVLPEYRQKGANALIFDDLIQQFQRYGFRYAEAMPQMEANEAVRSQWQYLESRQHRRHRCYCKNL